MDNDGIDDENVTDERNKMDDENGTDNENKNGMVMMMDGNDKNERMTRIRIEQMMMK